MKLYYKGTDKEVKVGDRVTDFRGEKMYVSSFREPTHGIGKVYVVKDRNKKWYETLSGEYYVSVYGLEWRDE